MSKSNTEWVAGMELIEPHLMPPAIALTLCTGLTSSASDICYLNNGVVFVGSQLGYSLFTHSILSISSVFGQYVLSIVGAGDSQVINLLTEPNEHQSFVEVTHSMTQTVTPNPGCTRCLTHS